jgi:hypothetical protein
MRRFIKAKLKPDHVKIGQSDFAAPETCLFPIARHGALFSGVFHVKHPIQNTAPARFPDPPAYSRGYFT